LLKSVTLSNEDIVEYYSQTFVQKITPAIDASLKELDQIIYKEIKERFGGFIEKIQSLLKDNTLNQENLPQLDFNSFKAKAIQLQTFTLPIDFLAPYLDKLKSNHLCFIGCLNLLIPYIWKEKEIQKDTDELKVKLADQIETASEPFIEKLKEDKLLDIQDSFVNPLIQFKTEVANWLTNQREVITKEIQPILESKLSIEALRTSAKNILNQLIPLLEQINVIQNQSMGLLKLERIVECPVCMVNPVTSVFNCEHCVCCDCAKKLKNDLCPLCRKPITTSRYLPPTAWKRYQ